MLQPWESYIGVDLVLCCAGTKGCCGHGKFMLVLTCLDVVQVQGDVADVGCGCRQAALLQPAGVHHWGLPRGQCQTGGVTSSLSELDTVETCLYVVQAPLYIVRAIFTLESPLFTVLRTMFTLRGPSLQC